MINIINLSTNPKNKEQLLFVYRNTDKVDDKVRDVFRRLTEEFKICQNFKWSQGIQPWVTNFNQIASMNLKRCNDGNVLLDSFKESY